MPTQTFRRIAALSTLTLLVSIGATMTTTSAKTSTPATEIFAPIKGYLQWRKVTPKPVAVVDVSLLLLCRIPTPQDVDTIGSGPHHNTYVCIYVNKAGEAAMYNKKPVKFPVGSVIVKERHTGEKGPLTLMTVMQKGPKGSHPSTGDWRYYVTDPHSVLLSKSSRLAYCEDCHARTKSSDYVYRTYLPEKLVDGTAPYMAKRR